MTKEKVVVSKCENYDYERILACVRQQIDTLGGVSSFIKPGQKILIKPNMLSCKTPDQAATTHPAVVQAVAEIFTQAGGLVKIGDSPPAIFGRADEFWERTGFKDAAAKSGAELLCFETAEKSPLSIFTNNSKQIIHVLKAFFEADLVINLPKLKTHNLTRITGAVKNLFGLVPGLQKAQWHKLYSRSQEFSTFITDLSHKLPVGLTILDAIEGMDGQGPAGGRRIFPGFLLASRCPVAIDRTFCAAAGITEESVAMLRRAREIQWGPNSFSEIEIVGEPIDAIKIKNFIVPGEPLNDRIPEILVNFLKKLVWAGPALKENKCIKCSRCVAICPVKAIQIREKGAEFKRKTCIACFCCMEVCPVDAIQANKSPLLEIAFRLRNLKKRLRRKK